MNRKELLRSLKFLLFSLSAGIIEIGAFSLLSALTGWLQGLFPGRFFCGVPVQRYGAAASHYGGRRVERTVPGVYQRLAQAAGNLKSKSRSPKWTAVCFFINFSRLFSAAPADSAKWKH